MGLFFIFGALHFLFIMKPFAVGDPLGVYVAYCLLPARMRPFGRYKIAKLDKTGAALAITMIPTGRALRYRPDHQIVFVRFNGSESHPFTISKAPSDD